MLEYLPTPDTSHSIARPPLSFGNDAGSIYVGCNAATTLVVLEGEVDAALRIELDEVLAEIRRLERPVEIDALHLTFIDSTGIAFLARAANGSVQPTRVLNAPSTVRFLLRITGVDELFDFPDGPVVAGENPRTVP